MPFLKVLFSVLVLNSPFVVSVAATENQPPDYARVTPADIQWRPLPSMPKGAEIALLHGDLRKPGLFTVRIKLPPHYTVPVHSHPDERVRTIISGTYYSATGDKFDGSKLMAFPAGTFTHLPPNTWEFAETRDEGAVFEVTGIAPTGMNYLNPTDDPRKSK